MVNLSKRIGVDYFHTHPTTEKNIGLDKEHVIVDKEEYKEVLDFLQLNRINIEDIVSEKTVLEIVYERSKRT